MKRIACWISIALASIGLCLAQNSAQPAAETRTRTADQSWKFTSADQRAGMLLYHNGAFFVTFEDAADPQWTFAGSAAGYHVGKNGFYVGNLSGDPNGATTLAFFDPQIRTWYLGAFSGTALTFTPVTGEVFHLDNGPYLFPAGEDDTETAAVTTPTLQSEGSLTAHLVAIQPQVPMQPVFPITAVQYSKLSSNRDMNTNLWIFADGSLSAVTRVRNGVWLAGYHGGVQVTLLDQYNRPVYAYDAPRIGVTGTAFGHSDVTVNWTASVPSNALKLTRGIAILQKWDPDFTTLIRDLDPWLKFILPLVQTIKTIATGK